MCHGLRCRNLEVSCFHVCRYLNDHASVDAISSKLREVCPSLYRNEDAACSKVTAVCLKLLSRPPDILISTESLFLCLFCCRRMRCCWAQKASRTRRNGRRNCGRLCRSWTFVCLPFISSYIFVKIFCSHWKLNSEMSQFLCPSVNKT